MAIARSLLTAGPAYVAYGSGPVNFHLADDSSVEIAMVTDQIRAALFGVVNETYRDMVIKARGTPLYYDASVTTGTFFPYISQASLLVGQSIFGASDVPVSWTSNNGDTIAITACAIGQMPELYLGADKPVLGPLEIWGIIGNSDDPSTANSYYTISTGNSFASPAVPSTSFLARQKWTAVWGSVAGFTSFQAQEGWTITHELELAPRTIQGRTSDYAFQSYRAMAKCKPIGVSSGVSMANIDAALRAQGSLKQGQQLNVAASATADAAAPDLVITGALTASVVTIKRAAMKTAGFMFGGKPLRQGEVGWVGTLSFGAGGQPNASLILS